MPLRRGFVGPVDFRLALLPVLEGVLEMREGQAGVGAREGRIEAHRGLEEMARLVVVGLAIPVHVPQAAVVRLPRVERARRLQDGAVALDRLDLAAMEATIRLPISSRTRNASSSLWLKVSAQTIRALRVSASSTVTVRRSPCAPHGSADDIVDVEDPAGLFRADAPLVQREHRPLRDDEEAAQLGEPGDHVVGERVGGPAADEGRSGAVDERHDRNGAAARGRCSGFIAAFERDYRHCPG